MRGEERGEERVRERGEEREGGGERGGEERGERGGESNQLPGFGEFPAPDNDNSESPDLGPSCLLYWSRELFINLKKFTHTS